MNVKTDGKESTLSIDKAFEWLLILAVLVGIILGYAAWFTTPAKNLAFMSDTLFTLVFPLVLVDLLWFSRYFTVADKTRSVLSMLSWSFLITSFLVDIVFLSAFVFFGLKADYLFISIVAVGVAISIGVSFPYRKIIEESTHLYVNKSLDHIEYWRQRKKAKSSLTIFFIEGLIIDSLLIILPFYLFHV